MEHLVLKVLGFNLSVPTSFLFLNKMVEMVPMDEDEEDEKAKIGALAAYLAELALVDGETFLRYPPSQVENLSYSYSTEICSSKHIKPILKYLL